MKHSNPRRRNTATGLTRSARSAERRQQMFDAWADLVERRRIVPLLGPEMTGAVARLDAVRSMPLEDIDDFLEDIRATVHLLVTEGRAVHGWRRSDGQKVLGHPYVAVGLIGGSEWV